MECPVWAEVVRHVVLGVSAHGGVAGWTLALLSCDASPAPTTDQSARRVGLDRVSGTADSQRSREVRSRSCEEFVEGLGFFAIGDEMPFVLPHDQSSVRQR